MFVLPVTAIVNGVAGWVSVVEAVPVQPLVSVIVTPYDPADRPDKSSLIDPLLHR